LIELGTPEPKPEDEANHHHEAKPTGIPGLKPPNPDQLPPEEAHQIPNLSSNPDLYGTFTDEDRRLQHQEQQQQEQGSSSTRMFDEEENAVEWFQKKTVEGFKYWAQFTQYRIKMDDGRIITYERVPITKYQSDELLDLSSEIQAGRDIDTDRVLSATKIRQKQKQLDIMRAKYYMRNVKTGQPMAPEELKHAADSTIIDSILEACTAITLAKWAEGKK